MSQRTYLKSGLNLIVKLLVTCLLFYVIHKHLVKDANVSLSFRDFYNSDPNFSFLIIAFLLMPLNWFVESLKWQIVMNGFSFLKLTEAIKSVLVGICFGIFTPARIGEYAGRSLVVKSQRNGESIYATFLCSVSQNMINIMLGLFFFSALAVKWKGGFNTNYFLGLNLVLLTLGFLLYFNLGWLIKNLSQVNFFKKYFKNLTHHKFANDVQIKLLVLSICRYAVYVVQFIVILKFFNLETSLFNYVESIASIYLIQSTVPIPPILDLFARGEIAVQFFDALGFMPINVILSSLTLWVINLILPALLGLVLLMKINVSKSLGYGEK